MRQSGQAEEQEQKEAEKVHVKLVFTVSAVVASLWSLLEM